MSNKRIIGLDFLRIFSMFGIIGLHVINQGGIIENVNIYSFKHYIILLLLIIFYTSVDIFGLLSGYLNITKINNKYSRIIELLFITIFYCILIPTIFYSFNFFNIRSSGIKEMLFNYIPILDNKYWYISCYVFMFLLIPYINVFCKSLEQKKFKKMLIIIFVLLTIIPNIILKDIFKIYNGYSPFWLIYCYMIGAYIRLYNIHIKKNIFKYLIITISITLIINSTIKNIEYIFLGNIIHSDLFINYISPFTLISSILILLLFKNIEFKNIKLKNAIYYLSGSAFSVYIIHCHRIIFIKIFKNLFKIVLNYNIVVMFFIIILSIILIYITCCIIDEVRKLIFKCFKLDILIKIIGEKFDKVLN